MLTSGLYKMSHGLQKEFERIDLLGQNLANAGTPGFRAVLFGERGKGSLDRWIGGETPAPTLTERALDVCPPPGDAFCVSGPEGTVRYTRRGDLRVDDSGTLVVGSGEPILSTTGAPITIEPRRPFEIDRSGRVVQGGKPLGTLARVSVDRPMRSGGSSVFDAPEGEEPSASTQPIEVGQLDSSDVNLEGDTTRLAATLARARLFQTFARAQDETVEQAIRDLGSSR